MFYTLLFFLFVVVLCFAIRWRLSAQTYSERLDRTAFIIVILLATPFFLIFGIIGLTIGVENRNTKISRLEIDYETISVERDKELAYLHGYISPEEFEQLSDAVPGEVMLFELAAESTPIEGQREFIITKATAVLEHNAQLNEIQKDIDDLNKELCDFNDNQFWPPRLPFNIAAPDCVEVKE